MSRLGDAHTQNRLHEELRRLAWTPLLVIDEVGYIPFDAEAANLFFQLVSSRYERASVIVTSNKPFAKAHRFARRCARWRLKNTGPSGRLVQAPRVDVISEVINEAFGLHAEVVNLKGESYRLKDRDLGRVPSDDAA